MNALFQLPTEFIPIWFTFVEQEMAPEKGIDANFQAIFDSLLSEV